MFEQDRVIVRLQQRALAESGLPVCMLSGSHGCRREDAYSDMDAPLVYQAEAARITGNIIRGRNREAIIPGEISREYGTHGGSQA